MKLRDDNFQEFFGPKPPQNDKERYELEKMIEDTDWFKDTEKEFSNIRIEEVSREQWGARPAKVTSRGLRVPVKTVALTYNTYTDECTSLETCTEIVRKIQNTDMDVHGRPDIGYSFLVGGDGKIYEGRGWRTIPALTEEQPESHYNNLIEVAYIGNFEYKASPQHMVPTLLHWVRQNVEKGNIIERFDYK